MEYKGVEYRLLQLAGGTGWRWSVSFPDGSTKTATVTNKVAASIAAKHAIDLSCYRLDNARPKRPRGHEDRLRVGRDEIMKALNVSDGITSRGLARNLSWLALSTVQSQLRELCEAGLARREGSGRIRYFKVLVSGR
jgi:hypothetical protein